MLLTGSNPRLVAVLAALVASCSAAGGDGPPADKGTEGNLSGSGGDSSGANAGAGGDKTPIGAPGGSAGISTSAGGLGQSSGAGGTNVAGGAGSSAGGTSTNDGGKSEAGGAVITQVGDCKGLGAAGKWEPVPIPGMDAPGEFVLDPRSPGTIYVGAAFNDAGVSKSTDCGATWQHVSTGRNSDKLQNGRCTTFQIDRTSGALYTNSLYGTNGIYKSTNGGRGTSPDQENTRSSNNALSRLTPRSPLLFLVTVVDCTGAPQVLPGAIEVGRMLPWGNHEMRGPRLSVMSLGWGTNAA